MPPSRVAAINESARRWKRSPDRPRPPPTPPSRPDRVDEEHLALEQDSDDIVSAGVAGSAGDDARLRDALSFLLKTVESAAFVDDGVVIAASRPAAERLLASCGQSNGSTSSALDGLFGVIQDRYPRT